VTPRLVILVLAAACGSTVPAPPPPVLANKPPVKATPAPAPPPAPHVATCDEVGAVLAGKMPADAIALTCSQFEWSDAVRTCVTTNAEPTTCLEDLSGHQRNALMGVLESATEAAAPASCDLAIWKIDDWPPALRDDAPERSWLDGARIEVAIHDCKQGWPQELITCLTEAYEKDKTLDCLAYRMDDAAREALTKKLRALEKVAEKIGKAKSSPAKVDCTNVVDVHYRDAKWKGRLPGVKADERKRLIEKSRELLLETCERTYSEDERACVVVTGELVPPCFDDHHASLWGYPAWQATL
jgi:hypothetical protein